MLISQPAFEQQVPAFRDSQPTTFEAIRPMMEHFLSIATDQMAVPEDYARQDLLEAYVYKNAAAESIPSLDLILTDSGFAVVSNQNLAPASRERVAALLNSLRRQASDARDLLLLDLCKTNWVSSQQCKLVRTTLLWCPMLARRYGITINENDPQGDFLLHLPSIEQASEMATNIIGQPLMDFLIANQDEHTGGTSYALVRENTRKYMAAVVQQNRRATEAMRQNLLRMLEREADDLPQYKESSTYRAAHTQGYENKQEDPTFFFA